MRVPGGDRAVDNLLRWADGEDWEVRRGIVFDAHVGRLVVDLEMDVEDLFEELGTHGAAVISFIVEDFLSAWFGDDGDENVVDEYLKRRGWLEKGPATRYLRALRDARPSLYEVQGVARGQSLTVRDLLRGGDPVVVDERLGSESVAQWDCIVARVVRMGRTRCFTSAVLHFPRELAEDCARKFEQLVKDVGKGLRKEARKDGSDLEIPPDELPDFLLGSPQAGPFFTACFVSWTLGRLAAPMPELRNSDDEALAPSTVRFPIAGTESEVAAALDGIGEFERSAGGVPEWGWITRLPSSPRRRGKAVSAGPDPAGTALSLGVAEIADGALFLRVNSIERAERGRDLLASRLGPLLGSPLTSHEDPAEWMRRTPEASPPEPGETELPPEAIEALHAFMADHYRKVLDEPIPALGDRSPRRAAKTKKGRAAVTAWIKDIENTESRAAIAERRAPVDLSWLWEELKIPKPGGAP